MDAKYSGNFIILNGTRFYDKYFQFPVMLDYLLTFILWGLLIALVIKVAMSDHLEFRWPWELH